MKSAFLLIALAIPSLWGKDRVIQTKPAVMDTTLPPTGMPPHDPKQSAPSTSRNGRPMKRRAVAEPESEKPRPNPCTWLSLTDNCKLLDPKVHQEHVLPDGTHITLRPPDPIPDDPQEVKTLQAEWYKGKEKFDRDRVKNRSRLTTKLIGQLKWGEITKPDKSKVKLSEDLLTHLTVYNADLVDIIQEKRGGPVLIPWPLEVPLAAVTEVKMEEVTKGLKTFFTEKQWKEIQATTTELENDQKVNFNERIVTTAKKENEKRKEAKLQKAAGREPRAIELFSFAKSNLIKMIRGKKTDSELTSAEKSAITKIMLVSFHGLSSPRINNPTCLASATNAIFTAVDHSVTFCKDLFLMPDETILATAAHELMHAIDPCYSQVPLIKLEPKVMASFTDPKTGTARADWPNKYGTDVWNQMVNSLNRNPNPDAAYMSSALANDSTPENMKFFQEKGVFTQVAAGVPLKDYVLKDVYNCLQTKAGGSFLPKNPSPAEKAKDVAQIRLAAYGNKKESNGLESKFEAVEECTTPGSQLNEALADWGSTAVLAEFSEGRKYDSAIEKITPFADLAIQACEYYLSAQARDETTLNQQVANAEYDKSLAKGAHPLPGDRINKILLADEKLATALGCPAQKTPCIHNNEVTP